MSINGAFSIGRTGLLASQVGLQVAGNNISNASSAGYTRQRLDLSPLQDQIYGRLRLGSGVDAQAIRRLTDRAMQQRAWNASSQQTAADTNQQQLESLETLLNSLGDTDTSTPGLDGPSVTSQLSAFFASWSTLSQRPNDPAARTTVIEQGRGLAGYIRDARANIVAQRNTIDTDLQSSLDRANSILSQIAEVNGQILAGGGAGSSGLLDRRDQLITELSSLVPVTVNEQPSGSADVLIGSTPLVVGSGHNPMTLRVRPVNGQTVTEVVSGQQNEVLGISSGRVGALLSAKEDGFSETLNRLDQLAAAVIFNTNRAYSVGFTGNGRSSYLGDRIVTSPTLAINDPANTNFNGLGFGARSGQVVVEVTGPDGSRQRSTIEIDLDGLTAAGTPGYTDDTSANSFITSLSGVGNVSAGLDVNGRVSITAASGYSVRFIDDTSGVLATLGVNSYFTGASAADINVSAALTSETLNSSTISGSTPRENGVAMAMVALRDQKIDTLGNATIAGYWDATTQSVSALASNAKTQAQASTAIKEAMDGQIAAITGVNLDEEAINLVQYQTMYQASARYIGVMQQITDSLLQLV